ncbi:hypothetical protein MMC29_003319 [Sticta canariensis]|nr:hypothetical protein [Sticta canariensis]
MTLVLPPEVLLQIFQHLGSKDKLRAERVCRSWHETLKSPQRAPRAAVQSPATKLSRPKQSEAGLRCAEGPLLIYGQAPMLCMREWSLRTDGNLAVQVPGFWGKTDLPLGKLVSRLGSQPAMGKSRTESLDDAAKQTLRSVVFLISHEQSNANLSHSYTQVAPHSSAQQELGQPGSAHPRMCWWLLQDLAGMLGSAKTTGSEASPLTVHLSFQGEKTHVPWLCDVKSCTTQADMYNAQCINGHLGEAVVRNKDLMQQLSAIVHSLRLVSEAGGPLFDLEDYGDGESEFVCNWDFEAHTSQSDEDCAADPQPDVMLKHFCQLTSLRHLDLYFDGRRCGFSRLPAGMSCLRDLRSILITAPHWPEHQVVGVRVATEISQLTSLTKLALANVQMPLDNFPHLLHLGWQGYSTRFRIPIGNGQLTKLRCLIVGSCEVMGVGRDISQMHSLNSFMLLTSGGIDSDNRHIIPSLLAGVQGLTALTNLQLECDSTNRFCEAPACNLRDLSLLKRLQKLSLPNLSMPEGELPVSFTALQEAMLFSMGMTTLTMNGTAPHLTRLSLQGNSLHELPCSKLQALQHLNADRNNLCDLPFGLLHLTRLTFLSVQYQKKNFQLEFDLPLQAWPSLRVLRLRQLQNCPSAHWSRNSRESLDNAREHIRQASRSLDLLT